MSAKDFNRIKDAFIEETFGDLLLIERHASFSKLEEPEASQVIQEDQPSLAPLGAPLADASLVELIDTAKQSLTLGAYIREKAHRRDMLTYRPALFEQGQISRDYWSRLLNDEIHPSKEKLLRLAILLRLSVEEADEMMDKAGYSMSPAILRDVVVEYCLRHRHYDFTVIEQLLADHQIQSLFNDRRRA